MNLNFPFIFPERIKHFSYQDTFKASYSSRHFYFSPVRHFYSSFHFYCKTQKQASKTLIFLTVYIIFGERF